MKMKSRPVTIDSVNGVSTPAKRTLFRVALTVALVGTVSLSTVLILQGGIALGRLRYFVDVGLHPLHITSTLLLVFGVLSLLAFVLLTIGIVKVNKVLATVAAILLGVCSIGLIAFSVWSFLTMLNRQLSFSIDNAIVKELDQTQFAVSTGNNFIIENTQKMARVEKQYRCCGRTEPLEEYRSRQPSIFGTLNPSTPSGSGRGRTTSTQRNTAAFGSSIALPISCCHESFRSTDNLCMDMFGNNTNPLNRYNTDGCSNIVFRYKFDRLQKQGFTTIIAACLAVISCIALTVVIRLLGEGYQIIPLRAAT